MKKIVNYMALMLFVVILLPFVIVRGCSHEKEEIISPPIQDDETIIKVLLHQEDKIVNMGIEEYMKGVLAAEMPAEFELEALKAQAVAARTYVYGRVIKLYGPKDDSHKGADVCTNPAHCLAWKSKNSAMKSWSIFTASRNWDKISRAVIETKGIILTYEGKVINALFHSNSGGRTENNEDVWEGASVPYLRSVESIEEDSPAYRNVVTLTIDDFIEILEAKYPEAEIENGDIMSQITVLEYTEGGRVKNIQIGNVIMKGTEFRTLFGLKSANFSIETSDDMLIIKTIGYGHGVGMSQWGANYLAKMGWNYNEILMHYYKGIEFESMSQLKEE